MSLFPFDGLTKYVKERFNNPAFVIPYPTMNFGHIHGGDAANRICGCCELHMDIRPLPGLTLRTDELLNEKLLSLLVPLARSFGRLSPCIRRSLYECPTDQDGGSN